MKFRIALFLLFLLTSTAFAQQTVTLSGTVKDATSGEVLIGATVFARESGAGTYTNEYGLYSLQVPKNDSATIVFSYLGYADTTFSLFLKEDFKLNIDMGEQDRVLDDVVIEANALSEKLKSSQMSVESVSMVEAKQIPALFGEVDIVKTLQLKPGVQSGGEGFSGLYVRGGGPDQNLILLDEAQVYNASHLFGLFSTFNGDAVKDVKLYKGGFPAEYGGKLSSVLDVRMNEGNRKKFAGAGGVGIISSRLTLEGPIVKDKASFILAGRRTYFDIITRQINRINEGKEDFNPIPDYYFYDLNGKINFDIGEKDRFFLSGYFGRDVFGFNDDDFNIKFNWGNSTATARWNHIFNPKLFLKTAFTFSDYQYNIKNQFSIFEFSIGSGVRDYTGKAEFYWQPNNEHKIRMGGQAIRHQFDLGRIEANSSDSSINFQSGALLQSGEYGVYFSDDWDVNARLKLNGGVRVSAFDNSGKWYYGVEPRASARFTVSENISVKAAYTRMFQYVHLVSNSGASLPTDIWYPSTNVVQPQRADQAAGGISFLINDEFLLTNEVYYKWLKNQIDFRDNAQIFANADLDEEFVFGKGWGYGNEIYLERKKGNLTGWIGYTLSWSFRQFEKISNGERFYPRYDRRHDISAVLIYKISDRLSVTGTWVYGTGNAVSLPIGRFVTQDPFPGPNPDSTTAANLAGLNIIPVYTERNGFRMPPYHRLDLGCVLKFYPKWGEADLTLSIYNVYNRRNPFFLYYDTREDENGNLAGFTPKQVSLFPTIPSLTFNFRF